MDRVFVLTTAANLISDDKGHSEYDRGVSELVKDLLGISPDYADTDAILEILRSIKDNR